MHIMLEGAPEDMQALAGDMRQVGDYLAQATYEVALAHGGDEFARRVAELGQTEEPIPDPAGFQLLEMSFPDSAAEVFERMREIQTETHERERIEQQHPRWRTEGRALLRGLGISRPKLRS